MGRPYKTTPAELEIWNQRMNGFIRETSRGIRSEEALAFVKHSGWKLNADPA